MFKADKDFGSLDKQTKAFFAKRDSSYFDEYNLCSMDRLQDRNKLMPVFRQSNPFI